MKSKTILSLLLLMGTIASCTIGINNYTETVEIEGVKRLKLSGVFNVNISQYDQESLEISGSEDLVKKLIVKQTGDLLELTLREKDQGGLFKNNSVQVNLAIADLTELKFDGAGNIKTSEILTLDDLRITGNGVGNIQLELAAESIDSRLNFVGNMELKGETNELKLVNEGIGNIDASQLTAQKVDLISSGIGAVSVHCEDELSIRVDGIGSVSYTGNPTVISEKISGLGRVNRN